MTHLPAALPASGPTSPRPGASDMTDGARDSRRLIAVVYADMVGYSRLIGMDDLETLERLRHLRGNLIDPAVDGHGGKIVQTGGDSLLIVFNSIDGAVRCAVKVQQAIPVMDGDQPPDRAIRFRVGINIGDAIADGTDLHGDAVNVAARLQAECPPGGICVSRAVRDHVHGRLDLVFEALGPLNLKNIERPVEAFVLQLDPDHRPLASHRAKNIVQPVAAAVAASPRRRWHRPLVVAAAVVAASLAAWAFYTGAGRDLFGIGPAAKPVEVATLAAPDHLARRPSVAVLPFKNLSGDANHDFFSDGTTEDVITALSRFSNLLVISKSASFPFKDSNASPADIGRLLDARYLLEGSIRRSGNRIRVGAALTEATTAGMCGRKHMMPKAAIFSPCKKISPGVLLARRLQRSPALSSSGS